MRQYSFEYQWISVVVWSDYALYLKNGSTSQINFKILLLFYQFYVKNLSNNKADLYGIEEEYVESITILITVYKNYNISAKVCFK